MTMSNRGFFMLVTTASALLLLMLLSGCSTVPQKDTADYAPTLPRSYDQERAASGSIYHDGSARLLFEDVKAHNVGDLVTIVLTESTNASKSASTNTTKESTIEAEVPTIFGTMKGKDIFNQEIGMNRDFAGSGDSSQSNSLTGTLTVTVAEVYPNGNLLVRGQKRVWLNQGEEFVQVRGIVRPSDISADNTVLSTRVADAQITYSGRGAVADSNAAGWLSRFFQSPIWPF